jgi:hypothetical protein
VRHLAALFLLASMTPASEAQTPDHGRHDHGPASQARVLDFSSLDERLTAAEQGLRDLRVRVDGLSSPGGQGRAAYAEARARAVRDGKPLIVWVGGGDALCPSCMHRLADEDGVVNFVAPSFPDTPAQALVVAVPEGSDLFRVATITRWVTGDPTWGHVPSVRRAVRNWRERRAVTNGGWSLDAAPVRRAARAAWGVTAAAARFRPARAAGGCAT